MTAVVIPGLDLAPSVPSRVVSVDLIDMTEGTRLAGEQIAFFLPGDLHVPADDVIIRAGSTTLTLDAAGHGEIRLPAYTDSVKPVDWVIGVKKAWAPHPYYIRVPPGSTTISLADIDPVQQIPAGLEHYLPTGVSLNVTEGGNWAGSGHLSGGIINLDLVVPPGGTAWHRGVLPNGTNLNSLQNATTSGVYQLSSSSTYLNNPVPGVAATLTVEATGFSGVQTVTQYASSMLWRRVMNNSSTNPRGWGTWQRYDVTRAEFQDVESLATSAFTYHGSVAPGADLRSITGQSKSGSWGLSSGADYGNYPPEPGSQRAGILAVFSNGFGDTIQLAKIRNGGLYVQTQSDPVTWRPWVRLDNIPSALDLELTNGRIDLLESSSLDLLTMWQTSGKWSTYGAAQAYLDRLARIYPQTVEVVTLGQSTGGRPIKAAVIGDPTDATLYVNAGTHGNETSSQEAALQLATRLADDPPTGMCVVIVPMLSPDGVVSVSRLNASGTDPNRQWTSDTFPETLAGHSIFDHYNVIAMLDCHEGGTWDSVQLAINEIVPPSPATALDLAWFNHVTSRINADAPWPAGVWVDERRIGSAMDTIPAVYGTPYLLVEMPGDLSTTYAPTPSTRVISYRVVMDAAVEYVHNNLASFVAAKPTG